MIPIWLYSYYINLLVPTHSAKCSTAVFYTLSDHSVYFGKHSRNSKIHSRSYKAVATPPQPFSHTWNIGPQGVVLRGYIYELWIQCTWTTDWARPCLSEWWSEGPGSGPHYLGHIPWPRNKNLASDLHDTWLLDSSMWDEQAYSDISRD